MAEIENEFSSRKNLTFQRFLTSKSTVEVSYLEFVRKFLNANVYKRRKLFKIESLWYFILNQ